MSVLDISEGTLFRESNHDQGLVLKEVLTVLDKDTFWLPVHVYLALLVPLWAFWNFIFFEAGRYETALMSLLE